MAHPRSSPLEFASVLCGSDNGPAGIAARTQASWLAAGGHVEHALRRELTGHGPAALAERCEGHDLLVLASDADAHPFIGRVPVPLLLARWCPPGLDVTDDVLVAVGDHAGAERSAHFAAQLARRHGGSVSVVAAPGRAYSLRHALAVTERIVLCEAGTPAHLVDGLAPPESAVPRAVAETGATLLVLSTGADAWSAEEARDIARRVSCSLLSVPSPRPVIRRFTPALAHARALALAN